jgi:hypothetical protein
VALSPISLLGNSSGFYALRSGAGRFTLSYGLTVDAVATMPVGAMTVGLQASADAYFAGLNEGSGRFVSYRLVGLLAWDAAPLPLVARVGFAQQWYIYGEEEPGVLVTSVPSPIVGVGITGVGGDGPLTFDAALDLQAIAFFTSYLDVAFDLALAAQWRIPVAEELAFAPRIGIEPQFLIGLGSVEFLTKIEIGIGVMHE